jgi:biotin carboxyl carrier protein
VRRGDAVGLVEVMKTFNQILYDGPGFPEEAEVVEVRCEDGQEVRVGEVLVVVR